MALTSQEQHSLIKLVVGMFGIAPGYSYLAVVSKGYEDLGRNLAGAADELGKLPQFLDLYPTNMGANAFATKFLGTLGLQNDAMAQSLVTDMFKAGVPPGQIILQVINALSTVTVPPYAAARALLENKAAVAYYHSQILGSTETDFKLLAQVLDGVTDNPATVEAAKLRLNPPPPPLA